MGILCNAKDCKCYFERKIEMRCTMYLYSDGITAMLCYCYSPASKIFIVIGITVSDFLYRIQVKKRGKEKNIN